MGPVEQLHQLGPLLDQVASGLTPADLDAPTPCSDFAVRDVLGHMIGGATQFAAAFRGTAPAEVPQMTPKGLRRSAVSLAWARRSCAMACSTPTW